LLEEVEEEENQLDIKEVVEVLVVIEIHTLQKHQVEVVHLKLH
jgi:hypothetical protein